MLNPKLEEALNKQLNAEMYSSYLYLSMAAYFHSADMEGFAHWMSMQSQEEMAHAMKFFQFINDRDGQVVLDQLDAPPSKWKSALDVFEITYKHECDVTESINQLADLADDVNDRAVKVFLQWFVSEQVEEEAAVKSIIQKLKMVGDSGSGLYMLDKDLAARAEIAPAAGEEAI
jgi:ferritin